MPTKQLHAGSSRSHLTKPLARPGDPFVTARGLRIQPENAPVDVEANQPKLTSKNYRASVKRTLKDLPGTPDIMNGVGCILLYTLMGVGDREIATALKIEVAQVKMVRKSAPYGECFDAIAGEFVNANSDLISARIAAYGHDALTGLAHIAMNGKQEGNKLRANIDILDRGGFTKKDNAARSVGGMNELRIVVIDGDKKIGVELGQETFNG